MDVLQAELLAEEITKNRAYIKAAVEAEKIKRLKERRAFVASFAAPPGYDQSEAATEAALQPLAAIEFVDSRGRRGVVQNPEGWLRVIEYTYRRHKAIYGAGASETMHQRYDQGLKWAKIYEGRPPSHRIVCQDRRKEFLRLLTLFAVQAGLVVVE